MYSAHSSLIPYIFWYRISNKYISLILLGFAVTLRDKHTSRRSELEYVHGLRSSALMTLVRSPSRDAKTNERKWAILMQYNSQKAADFNEKNKKLGVDIADDMRSIFLKISRPLQWQIGRGWAKTIVAACLILCIFIYKRDVMLFIYERVTTLFFSITSMFQNLGCPKTIDFSISAFSTVLCLALWLALAKWYPSPPSILLARFGERCISHLKNAFHIEVGHFLSFFRNSESNSPI